MLTCSKLDSARKKLELSLGETITYTNLARTNLKTAERYKKNCLRLKSERCIYCDGRKLKLISGEFKTFKCLQCNKNF